MAMSVLAACGPGNRPDGAPDAPGPVVDSPPAVDMSRVYAHSADTLYRMNAQTFAAVPIGPMTNIGAQGLTDLAIDNADHMVGITREKLFSIDPATGAATLIKDLSQSAQGFTSLSYVPDPMNPAVDILISANDQGAVFKVDPLTGDATQIGSYGNNSAGKKIVSSGDIIGVRGFGIYATVDVGTEVNDYLAVIDPANGWKATPLPYPTMKDHIFGLGFWGGKVYGFVADAGNAGQMVQIDPTTGASTDKSSGAVRWFGAAVATDAPTIE
jgi:hypothetical protein